MNRLGAPEVPQEEHPWESGCELQIQDYAAIKINTGWGDQEQGSLRSAFNKRPPDPQPENSSMAASEGKG